MKLTPFIKAIFAMILIAQTTFAQKNAIMVSYIKQMKIPSSIEQIEDMTIRQLAISKLQQEAQDYTLYYNRNEYAFSQAAISDDGTTLAVEGNNSVYVNREKKQTISLERILDKLFVVEDTIAKYNWDIKYDEAKDILGKHCVKAVLDGDPKVIAWFCDEIPAQVGPLGYDGLPGLILKLENSAATYEATLVDSAPDNIKIDVPQKGRIPVEEFKAIKARKLKELGVTGEGGGKVIVLQ